MTKAIKQTLSIIIAMAIFIMPMIPAKAEYNSGRIGIGYQGDNEIHYIGTDVQSSICLQLTDSDTRSSDTYSWYSSDDSVLLFQVQAYTDDYKSCAIFQGISEGTAFVSTNISSDSEKVLVSVSTPIDNISAKTNKSTSVYAAASSNSTIRRVLDSNYSLTVNAKCGDYYKVEFPDGTGSDSIFEGEYYVNKSDLDISTSSIVLDSGYIELECGESHNTIVTVLPAISNTTIKWFSSNDSIASVDQNGVITAVGAGITQITAVDITNGVSNSIVVSVFKYSSDLTFRAVPDYNYIKDAIKPNVMIKDGTDILDKNSDYELSYRNNVNVGTAEITITFKNHYKGTKKVYFEIIPSEAEDVFEIDDIIDQKYNFGNPITPQIPVFCNGKQLVLGTDYTINYYNNVDCGIATAVITGMNGFTGSVTKYFNIKAISSSDPKISVSKIANAKYTGNLIKPTVTVKYDGANLVKDKDYTVEYENNVLMGLATARITFKGNYSGEIEKNFYIVPQKAEIVSEIRDNSFFAQKDCVSIEYKSQANYIDNSKYTLFYRFERNGVDIGSTSNGFLDDDDVDPCTQYTYRVRTGYYNYDGLIEYGDWSDNYYVGTAPENLTLRVGHNSANYPLLTVSGQGRQSNGVTVKYEIWRYENANLYDAGKLSMIADNLTATQYTDTSAKTGMSYWYTVIPYYEISVPESNGTTSTRRIYGEYTDKEWGDMPLPTPTNFTAVYNEETGNIRFKWKDVPGTIANKYHIVNYTENGSSLEGQIVEGNSYTWNAAELTPNTTYRFRILSENTLYNTHSNPSNPCITVTTTLKTPKISELSTGSRRNGIKIELSDTYGGRYAYELYYSNSQNGGYSLYHTISGLFPYLFLCSPDATYYFKLRAVVEQNGQKYYSDYSAVESFKLGLPAPTVTDISRDDTNNDKFKLKWSSVVNAVSYDVYAYKGDSNTGKYIKNVTGTSTNIPYSSLDSGSYYYFKVRARGTKTTSELSSNRGLGVTPVSGLSVSSNSPGTATVVFTKGNCPTYRIEYKKSSESDNDYKPVTVDTNSHTIHGLVETTTYNFRVKGIKNNSWSGMSKVVNCNISRTMPTLVKITKDNVSICVGNTYKLKAEVTPLKSSQSVNWSSSNTSVATVDVDGTVTAKKAGTVTITAKSSLDSSKKASCTVTVIDPTAVEYIRLTKDVKGEYTIVLTKFYNGDFYYQAYGEKENEWGDLYSLSQENKDWLDKTYNTYYNNYISKGKTDAYSIAHKVYLAKSKLITTVNKGTWPISLDSDEFYGMWMHYTGFECAYAEATHLIAQAVQTAVIIGTTVYQTVVTVKSALTLSNQYKLINASEYAAQASYTKQMENSLSGTKYYNKSVTTAEWRNEQLAAEGYTDPPCKAGTPVIGFKTTQSTGNQFIKLGSSTNIKPGAFVTKVSDIQGLTPEQIKSKLALPYTPTHFKYVNIPANQQMYMSITNDIYGGAGGFVQYDFGYRAPESWYSSALPISQITP